MKKQMNRQELHGDQVKQQNINNKPRPENKDNLDSRERKESGYQDGNNRSGRKSNTKDRE